jgi:succinate-semialdehyde dehydrogenase/glutarate-semialdehyde dehydrogenase
MTLQSVSFYDGKVLNSFEDLTDSQLEAALFTAHGCCEPWRSKSYAERATVLAAASAIMLERLDDLAFTMSRETGRALSQSRGEVALCANIIDYYARSGNDFLPKARPGPRGDDRDGEPRTMGILFAVEPWNLPYYELTRFAAPNLMAGSVVMVKHAEHVPQCAEDFARLWLEAGALAGTFTNLLISPDQVNRVIEDPRVEGVALMGRVDAGNRLGERAKRIRRDTTGVPASTKTCTSAADREIDPAIRSAVWGDLPGYFGPRIS